MHPNALKAYHAKKRGLKKYGSTYQLPTCTKCGETVWLGHRCDNPNCKNAKTAKMQKCKKWRNR